RNLEDLVEYKELSQILDTLELTFIKGVSVLKEILPKNYLIKEGLSAVIEKDQIIIRPIYGLSIYLKSSLNDKLCSFKKILAINMMLFDDLFKK
ncbi:unnamed protein product, partial [marine sediment metagenome]